MDETVLVAHYDENLSWIKNIRDRHVVVASHTKADADIYIPTNLGCEASLFLAYIILNYNDLTEYTFFVHGHRTSYHHNGNLDDLINKMDCTVPYKNINLDERINFLSTDVNYNRIVPLMFGEDLALPHPLPFTVTRACAMFYVHRDCIRRNPLDLYIRFYRGIMEGEYASKVGIPDKWVAICFEWMWFPLFTGRFNELQYEGEFDNKIQARRGLQSLEHV